MGRRTLSGRPSSVLSRIRAGNVSRMSQIETTTVEHTLPVDTPATSGADFDCEAVAVEARASDWTDMLSRVDIDQILADHPLSR